MTDKEIVKIDIDDWQFSIGNWFASIDPKSEFDKYTTHGATFYVLYDKQPPEYDAHKASIEVRL